MEDQLFEQLLEILAERSPEEREAVGRAYEYAKAKHAGQVRKNNENYIVHPVNVAIILANIPVDTPTVMAALLHDVLEDTDATPEEMRTLFGEEVLGIVQGVTKLGKIAFSSKEDRQAENFRRMFLAMAEDIRVILLKLGDRLHNMRTIHHLKAEKQQRIAEETLEIFAPLANRMGMGKIRAELEDLSFQVLHPACFDEIAQHIQETQVSWDQTVQLVIGRIQAQLAQVNIQACIYGRVKNYFSIYKKMENHQKQFDDIYDVSAFRIIVGSEKECYEALGVVHSAFTPIPGRFKDYVAMPKSNLYRSLHTAVIGPEGRPLEVQIRTHEMHRTAEYGIAAHWKYKDAGGSEAADSHEEQKLSWLKQMIEMKDDADDAREYVDSIKLDLFRDEVFVFTPKGKVVDLPRGSTPVDFAYRIHTQVGHACTGSMVNGRIVPLNHVLRNGDIVEIITSKKAEPRLDWIKFVQTQQAKSRIRQWYKHHFREAHEAQGHALLEAELTKATVEEATRNGKLLEVAKDLNYVTLEDMFMALGYGELNTTKVINRLKREQQTVLMTERFKRFPAPKEPGTPGAGGGSSQVQGLRGMLYHLAKCCTPVPGDAIVGVVTRSRGVMIHRDDCINLSHVNPDRQMWVNWEGDQGKNHSVKLEVQVIDRVGALKDILTEIADTNTNVTGARVKVTPDQTALVEVTVEISDLAHLETLKTRIRRVKDVISVKRQVFRGNRVLER
jgi:guanosine-3',5'-bis(diphosphate) 3'-pyrophosphohydrolase